jgi:hypothetical protein
MAVLATETASATAGREGKATSPDGKIDLKLSRPGPTGRARTPNSSSRPATRPALAARSGPRPAWRKCR